MDISIDCNTLRPVVRAPKRDDVIMNCSCLTKFKYFLGVNSISVLLSYMDRGKSMYIKSNILS